MFTLYMVESLTGVVVNSEGSYHLKGEELGYKTQFETENEAIAEKDRLLSLVPWQTCQICEGNSEDVSTYLNEEVHSEYLRELYVWRKYLMQPWFKKIFIEKPKLKYIKS